MGARPRSSRVPIVLASLAVLAALLAAPGSALAAGGATSARHAAALPPKVKQGLSRLPGHTPVAPHLPAVKDKGRMGFCGGDDWEPEIAADAATNHVYVVWAHFPGATSCDPGSGNPNRIYIAVSADGGATFGPGHVVADLVSGVSYPSQVDCVVTVGGNGTVYVSFLAYGVQGQRTDVAVATSTDFGATFTARKVNGLCSNCDHPWTAASGSNVYVMYAQGGGHYLARSANFGATWTESQVLKAGKVAFPEGAVVDAAGNAWFAWGDCRTGNCTGSPAADYRVSKTNAGTSTTTFTTVAAGDQGPDCPFNSCGFAYFGPQDDIAIDAGGNLYLVWQDGQPSTTAKTPTAVFLSRSTNGGASWQLVGRVDDKTASGCAGSACYALFPRVEGGAANQIGAVWMDDRNGSPLDHRNGWNVWYRSSSTGGTTWATAGRRVSSFDPSRPESQPNGFGFPYGDYQGLDLIGTSAVMVWGEGTNYDGGSSAPGHVIYASVPI
jgi:hypothetical protein